MHKLDKWLDQSVLHSIKLVSEYHASIFIQQMNRVAHFRLALSIKHFREPEYGFISRLFERPQL